MINDQDDFDKSSSGKFNGRSKFPQTFWFPAKNSSWGDLYHLHCFIHSHHIHQRMWQILITPQDKIMLPQIIKSISPRLTPCYHYQHNDDDDHHQNFQFYPHQTSPLKVLYHWLVQASLLIVKIQTDLDDQVNYNVITGALYVTICTPTGPHFSFLFN